MRVLVLRVGGVLLRFRNGKELFDKITLGFDLFKPETGDYLYVMYDDNDPSVYMIFHEWDLSVECAVAIQNQIDGYNIKYWSDVLGTNKADIFRFSCGYNEDPIFEEMSKGYWIYPEDVIEYAEITGHNGDIEDKSDDELADLLWG